MEEMKEGVEERVWEVGLVSWGLGGSTGKSKKLYKNVAYFKDPMIKLISSLGLI